jgi:hypothetical protein
LFDFFLFPVVGFGRIRIVIHGVGVKCSPRCRAPSPFRGLFQGC